MSIHWEERGNRAYLILRWREGGKNHKINLASFPKPKPELHAPQILQGDAREVLRRIPQGSVHLVVTSPPYYQLKEGTWTSYADYTGMLDAVWKRCFMVLDHGCRLCVNIGDEYTSTEQYGRHKAIPIHADVIRGAESAEFDYMGSIIWRKAKVSRSSGGGSVKGSWASGYPRESLPEFNHEFILLFKKPGRPKRTPTEHDKIASKMPPRERNAWIDALWIFPGERKTLHPAPFPEELPYRLIRMFSFVGDTVLDPFMGSGTTLAVAARLARRSIGIDIEAQWCEVARSRVKSLRID